MEENKNLLVRASKRVSNKLHSSKVWKKIASLVLAGAIGVTMTGCQLFEGNQNNQQQEQELDLTNFSFFTRDIFEDEYCQNLNESIKNNLKNGFKLDVYGNPYGFWESKGVDVEKIKSGEIACRTNAFILNDELHKLYMLTSLTRDNSYYEQYLISYDLTEQEAKEYFQLHLYRFAQSLYLNDLISRHKQPTILAEGKIDIKTYDALTENFNSHLCLSYFMDFLMFQNPTTGKVTFSMYACSDSPSPAFKPSADKWGIQNQSDSIHYREISFKDYISWNTDNGIIKVDESTINPEDKMCEFSEYDKNAYGFKMGYQYPRQDRTLELFPQVFTWLEPENIVGNSIVVVKEETTTNPDPKY